MIGQLVERARAEGITLTGEGGLLQQLTKTVIESALEGEMTDHLGYDKHDPAGAGSGNSRNGHGSKTVTTETGPVQIEVPRDRAGTFEPKLVRKRQRRMGGVDEMVLSLSARGLTHGEISAHLAEVYGASVSKQTISTITDSVIEGMHEWQNRPLDPVYPVIFIDAVHVKIRDGHVANRPIYVVMAVTVEGTREILGLWAGDGGEGAKYPAIVRLWENAWAEFVPFLQFDVEIRRIVCTTNAIESVNARIRKAVRARGHFPTEQAALKCVYLAIMSLDPSGTGAKRWTRRPSTGQTPAWLHLAHQALDTTTPGGRLVFHVFAALKEFIPELSVQGTVKSGSVRGHPDVARLRAETVCSDRRGGTHLPMNAKTTTRHDSARPFRQRASRGGPQVALGVAAAVLAVGATACGGDPSGTDGSSSPAATEDGATAAQPSHSAGTAQQDSAEPGASGGGGALNAAGSQDEASRCTAKALKPAVAAAEPAAGNVYYDLKLTNGGQETCVLKGFPGVSLIQRDGAVIGEPADREGDRGDAVTLKPGQAAHADLHTVNKGVSDAGCWDRPDLLKIYPPGSRDALTLRTDEVRVCGDTFTVTGLTASSG
ncbi:hypothetical protein N566_14600 [Streptomycetaceae bacterium MP113-05]|nr:hypothetical protein N566_14600 [Streptomycetaceae bacterium MP113-05]